MHVFRTPFIQRSGWRFALLGVLLCATVLGLGAQEPLRTGESEPTSGPAALDQRVSRFMLKWGVRDGSLAVVRDGKLVHTQHFSRRYRRAVSTGSAPLRFRIASLSKSITGAAILKLAQDGVFTLDTPVFDVLGELKPFLGDQRMADITIRHLLQHAAGWDSAISGDPVFPTHEDIREVGGSFPPTHEEVLAYWLSRPLDFQPGDRYAYSNFGYLLLARVVEAATGKPYGEWVREALLDPLGISQARIGSSVWQPQQHLDECLAPEAIYVDLDRPRTRLSIFSDGMQPVLTPYGSFSLSLFDGAGGWVFSGAELARFYASLAGDRDPMFSQESMTQLVARQAFDEGQPFWYGAGVNVLETPDGLLLGHAGRLPGTATWWVRFPDGTHVVALFSTTPAQQEVDRFSTELEEALLVGLSEVEAWPDQDGFRPGESAAAATADVAPLPADADGRRTVRPVGGAVPTLQGRH
ncbi:MAG: beta-lactamase family protein [Bryobacterales bacterium]|nr:beta-lactamase family protein [Bryobacterales bacterium]